MLRKVGKGILLVCLLILVAAILYPLFATARFYSGPGRSNERLMFLALALQQYAKDNNGYLPPMQNPDAVKRHLEVYTRRMRLPRDHNPQVWTDPDDGQLYLPNRSLSGKILPTEEKTLASTIAFYMPYYPAGGSVVGWRTVTLSGRTGSVKAADWPKARKRFALP